MSPAGIVVIVLTPSSPDQAEALGRVLVAKSVGAAVGPCSHPIDENIRLARRLGVHSTPTVFLPNGQSFAGYRPASDVLVPQGMRTEQR